MVGTRSTPRPSAGRSAGATPAAHGFACGGIEIGPRVSRVDEVHSTSQRRSAAPSARNSTGSPRGDAEVHLYDTRHFALGRRTLRRSPSPSATSSTVSRRNLEQSRLQLTTEGLARVLRRCRTGWRRRLSSNLAEARCRFHRASGEACEDEREGCRRHRLAPCEPIPNVCHRELLSRDGALPPRPPEAASAAYIRCSWYTARRAMDWSGVSRPMATPAPEETMIEPGLSGGMLTATAASAKSGPVDGDRAPPHGVR